MLLRNHLCSLKLLKLSSTLQNSMNELIICHKQNFKTFCVSIEFLVECTTDKWTLNHIKGLLSKAFGNIVRFVQVRAIDDTITIIWYVPITLMDFLLISAENNLYLLKKIGVLKLTINYHTICDKCKSDEVRHVIIRQKILSFALTELLRNI